ncbi:HlyD family secretion protein [Dongia sedimenti]|uniref:HlyD family secretion protein n=1 Tax=Dongia sedimenti TaxID=3064282 RepID=A0ABU0YU23_9PROT|nr:HlyD family secretion protein [Rhodospirillaceae bacterium R-7]
MPDSGSAPDAAAPGGAPHTIAPGDDGVSRAFRKRRRWRRLLLVLGPIAVIAVSGYVYLTGGRFQGTDNAYIKAHMTSIAPEISGRVAEVPVHENQVVKQGEILLQIDQEPLKIALAGAQAELASARNDIEAQKAAYRQRQSDLQMANDNVGLAKREYARREKLFNAKTISESDYDEARNSYSVAQAQVSGVKQDIQRILSDLNGNPEIAPEDHPKVQAAQAKVDQAELDLRRATIAAPGNGIVSQIDNIRPGTYLTAGRPAFSLVSNNDLWIDANLKETDLTYVKAGQEAHVSVDTYPDVDFVAEVQSVGAATGSEFSALPAQNATGNWVKVVQRIPVRLKLEPKPDQPQLRAGMSVEVEIDTGHTRSLPSLIHSAMAWIDAEK